MAVYMHNKLYVGRQLYSQKTIDAKKVLKLVEMLSDGKEFEIKEI